MAIVPRIKTTTLPSNPARSNYLQIWHALRDNSADTVVVRCPRHLMETLIQAVKKVKSAENVGRKATDQPHWGRLVIKKNVDKETVSFSLTYSVEALL